MLAFLQLSLGSVLRLFCGRQALLLENLAMRQQLVVFKRQRSRPRLVATDKLFWVLLRRYCPSWKQLLVVVSPDTVVRWHRTGSQLYWRTISRARKLGRKPVTKE